MLASFLLLAQTTLAAVPDDDMYLVAVRSEARAVPEGTSLGSDIEFEPALALRWRLGSTHVDGAVSPMVIVHDVTGAHSPDGSVFARLRTDTRFEPSGHFNLGQDFRYGVYEFASLVQPVPSETYVVAGVPTAVALPFLYSNTLAQFSIEPWRRTHFSVLGSFVAAGGADAEARTQLPFGRGASGKAIGGFDLSARTTLDTALEASQASFSSGAGGEMGDLIETLRWSPLPLLETRISAGVGAIDWFTAGSSPALHVMPVARFTLNYGAPHGAGSRVVGAYLNYGPYLDWIYAAVYPRVDGAVWMEWGWSEHVTVELRGGAGASTSTDEYRGIYTVLGNVGVAYLPTVDSRVELGGRVAWQNVPMVSPTPYLSWTLYVGASLGRKGVF